MHLFVSGRQELSWEMFRIQPIRRLNPFLAMISILVQLRSHFSTCDLLLFKAHGASTSSSFPRPDLLVVRAPYLVVTPYF